MFARRSHHPWFAAVVFLALLAAGCAQDSKTPTSAGFRELTPSEASSVLTKYAGDPSFAVLDVRTPDEFRRERIGGARNVDFHAPGFREALAGLDKGSTYLVYCRTGNRSGKTLPILRELGFTKVLHLTQGITAWKNAGLPVELGTETP